MTYIVSETSPIQEVENITSATLHMARDLVNRVELAMRLIEANGLENEVSGLGPGQPTGMHQGAYSREQFMAVLTMYRALLDWVHSPFEGTDVAPIVMLYRRWPTPVASEV